MNNNFYITTPIYYVNGDPHIGHAYTNIIADTIARFIKLSGLNTFFITGTDEHGQKIAQSAALNNSDIMDFINQKSQKFQILFQALDIGFNYFIRTTEAQHKKCVAYCWTELIGSGNIYKGKYEGWYSVRDETFYSESELSNGMAPTGAPVEFIAEPSYFFALSKWQDKLLMFYDQHPDFIYPKSKYNEVINFVKSGLRDLSISRNSDIWGIKVPNDDTQTIYVWFDALINYLSALQYAESNEYKKWWPPCHIVGKDIIIFHAVYWVAFLLALKLEPPKSIIANGWWVVNGQKMSKSIGNVIDPLQLIHKFGVDYVRYFLLREINIGADGNYSLDLFINRINTELVNKIGNLVQRVMSFLYQNNSYIKYQDNMVNIIYDSDLLKFAMHLVYKSSLVTIYAKIPGILGDIVLLAQVANIYIEEHAPWALKNTDQLKMTQILWTAVECIRYIGTLLQPFIPSSADKILNQLNITKRNFKHLTSEYIVDLLKCNNHNRTAPVAIFPKIEI